jgi:N-sulfoglucosamine sulfohydrolase
MHGGYHDIDECPTLDLLVEKHADPQIGRYLELAVGKRPEEELFDIRKDPACLLNLAKDPAFREVLLQHRSQLGGYLMQTEDPRVIGNGDVYESYVRYSPIRQFPAPEGEKKDSKSF